jgi:endonuclease/exonuclease/phosphatase family metal-dependent hydrolase
MKWLLIFLAGCGQFTSDGTAWQDVATITGELAPELGADPIARDASSTLRVATFNVHFADDVADLAAQIQASQHLSQADVIVVQELRRYASEPVSRAQHLAELLGMTYAFVPAHTIDDDRYGHGVHGLAMFSRFPLRTIQVRELPFVDQTFNPELRIALRADVVVGTEAISVVDVHLDTRVAPSDRIRQLDPALDDAPARAIIAGDFNTLPWTWVGGAIPLTASEAVLGQQSAKLVDGFMEQNGYARAAEYDVVTARYPPFEIRLDNVYARGFTPLAGGVEHVEGSDHWPIYFDLRRGRTPLTPL